MRIDTSDPPSYTLPMAMGKRRRRPRQQSMWVATQDLPRSAAHPFYAQLNRLLDAADFDTSVEGLCQPFYADTMGRPSLPPGRYFRLLLIGYFEGLDAERAIAWRAADSLSVRHFLGLFGAAAFEELSELGFGSEPHGHAAVAVADAD